MFHFYRVATVLIGLTLFTEQSRAEDSASPRSQTVIVTSTRLESSQEETPGTASVIDSREIARKQLSSVGDLLREVPGVTVTNQGGDGRATSIFLRGTNPEHVLVLIDGVKANDPMHPGRAFDFGSLNADDIERVEILKGPGSVLYGSDAMGGVVQIITKKGKGLPRTSVESEYGTYDRFGARASVRGSSGKSDYSLSGDWESSRGYSSASEAAGNSEKDSHSNWRFAGRGGGEPIPGIRADVSARYAFSRFDLDLTGGPNGDDPNYTGEAREMESRLSIKPTHVDVWEPIGALSLSLHQRLSDNDPDPAHSDWLHGRYDSTRVQGQFQNNFYLSDRDTLVAGAEVETESGSSLETSNWSGVGGVPDRRTWVTGFFIQNQLGWERIRVIAGSRADWHDRYGWVETFRLAPSYDLARISDQALTLKASVGSGFKAPSLYQLYAPTYGNPGLLPERNLGYDVGLQWSGFSVTWFGNTLENLITGNAPSFVYQNIGRARTDGLELAGSVDLSDVFTLAGNYTFTRTVDEATGLALLRRPMHQGSAELSFRPQDKMRISLGGRYVGSRWDLDAVQFDRKELSPYFVARAAARIDLGKSYRLQARIENLFDERYEEIDGYGTAGRSVYIGVGMEL